MASHSGILDRQSGAQEALSPEAVSMPDARRASVFAKGQRSIWDANIVFLLIASVFNAALWWGLGTLILGNSWSISLLVFGFVIWLLTFLALALCSAGGE